MSTSPTRWTDRLSALLTDADAAAASGDLPRVLAAVEALRAFIRESPAPAADDLDAVAAQRAHALLHEALKSPLHDLASRTQEHEDLAGRLTATAEASHQRADDLRLEPLRRALPIAQALLPVLRDLVGGDTGSQAYRALKVAEDLVALLQRQLEAGQP